MTSNLQFLFAERIGGSSFGKVNKVFKFTLIDNAKKEFIANNPHSRVIDMGVGEPEERACDEIASRLYQAALEPQNRIYPNNGTLEFKQAAARYLKRLIGLEFDPQTEIVHCIGAKTGLAQVPFAFINSGDTVLSTSPGYPVLPTMVEWLGGKVVKLPLVRAKKFLPDIAELKTAILAHSPKLLLLNYPNNPTGATASLDFYKQVVELAHHYNFVIVQDAAYSDYVFLGEYCSPFQVAGGRDVTIELYSLSKGYNMQGYRLGFVVSNPTLLKAFALVKDNIDNGQFIATQLAGCEALDSQTQLLEFNRTKYLRRLQRSAKILNNVGIEAATPAGTFYLYFEAPDQMFGQTFTSAQSFSDYLVRNLGIVTVPWDDAGKFVRLSMTFEIQSAGFSDEDDLFEELERRLTSGRITR